jgi:hypothetical protein
MCGKQHCFCCWGLACLLSCLPLVMPWAEGTSVDDPNSTLLPQGSNTTIPEMPPTDPWDNFDSAWTSLKLELNLWSEDSQMLYGLLEALQTEAEGLRSSLMLSTEQLLASETARLEERQATELLVADARRRIDESASQASEAVKQADRASRTGRRWRNLAFGAAGIGALGWIAAWPGIR